MEINKKYAKKVLLIVLLFLVSVSALVAGALLIIDRSGKLLGMTTDILSHSSFQDFLVPGILLFCFIGISTMIVAIAVIRKARFYELYILMQGCVLVGWIGIQMVLIRTIHPMQICIALIGVWFVISGRRLIRE